MQTPSLKKIQDLTGYEALTARDHPFRPISSLDFGHVERYKLEQLKSLLAKINPLVLAHACMQAAQKFDIPEFEFVAVGGFNAVFRAVFISGEELIIRFPLNVTPSTLASTVATMSYARNVLQIPCPAVLAWNDDIDNAVGLPYIVMEKCGGRRLDVLWVSMTSRERLYALHRLAESYVNLTRGQPFQCYGRIQFDQAALDEPLEKLESYTVGPWAMPRPFLQEKEVTCVDYVVHPSNDIRDLWFEMHDAMVAAMKARWEGDTPYAIIQEPDDRAQITLNRVGIHTWGEANALVDNLSQIIRRFTIPSALRQVSLIPMDFAFRNIMYDNEEQKVCGILDWDEVALLPAFLINHLPEDLIEQGLGLVGLNDPVQERLIGDWSTFQGKCTGWYRNMSPEARHKEFILQLSEIDISIEESSEVRRQQIFVEFLRLWGFERDHFLIDDGNKRLGLAAPSTGCKDGAKIHQLLQGDYISWCSEKEWLSDKAAELKASEQVLNVNNYKPTTRWGRMPHKYSVMAAMAMGSAVLALVTICRCGYLKKV